MLGCPSATILKQLSENKLSNWWNVHPSKTADRLYSKASMVIKLLGSLVAMTVKTKQKLMCGKMSIAACMPNLF